jgi:hypothetical protein
MTDYGKQEREQFLEEFRPFRGILNGLAMEAAVVAAVLLFLEWIGRL